MQFGTWLRANSAGRLPMVGRNARLSIPTRPVPRVKGPADKSIGLESRSTPPLVSHGGSQACPSPSLVRAVDGKSLPVRAKAQPMSGYVFSATGPMQEGISGVHYSDAPMKVSPLLHAGRHKATCSLNTGAMQ